MLDVLQLPHEIICYNRFHVDGFEALCIMLKRFAYPCRYLDVMVRFAKPVPQLCMASNHVMNLIYTQWNHLLTDLDQPWLSPANLQQFAEMIDSNGGALQTCWAWVFVDGTVRPVSRPGRNQRVFHNGHKKVHSIKFQSVVAPKGLVANLYGPVEGKRHDSGMLAQSRLLAVFPWPIGQHSLYLWRSSLPSATSSTSSF